MSDGTAQIRVLDPATLAETGRIDVKMNGRPMDQINELEFIKGEIWANVFQTDRIVRIDPATGAVTGVLDVPHLRPAVTTTDPDAVLNGIARDPATGRFLLTGKRWPVEYDVQIDQA